MDAANCRAKAARFRDCARETRDPLIHDMLLDLAREWEARADRIEASRWSPLVGRTA
jgi:hypothetical protein